MKKKKIIEDIIGKKVEKYGFTYDKIQSSNSMWVYTREVDSIKQMIMIQEHRFKKSLFLRFDTTAWGVSLFDAISIIPKDRLPAPDSVAIHLQKHMPELKDKPLHGDSWSYETEEDFKLVLVEFLDIIETYGFDKLNEMSVEPKAIPTVEMAEKLLSFHSELSKEFINRYKLIVDNVSKENICQWFNIIESILIDIKDKPYNNIQDILVLIAAFLGEQLRKEMGGEWKLGKDIRTIYIQGLNGYIYKSYHVLNGVVEAWNEQDFDYFREYYLLILDNKLPLTIEQMSEFINRKMPIKRKNQNT